MGREIEGGVRRFEGEEGRLRKGLTGLGEYMIEERKTE